MISLINCARNIIIRIQQYPAATAIIRVKTNPGSVKIYAQEQTMLQRQAPKTNHQIFRSSGEIKLTET